MGTNIFGQFLLEISKKRILYLKRSLHYAKLKRRQVL
jgi:hypothetical protein